MHSHERLPVHKYDKYIIMLLIPHVIYDIWSVYIVDISVSFIISIICLPFKNAEYKVYINLIRK